MYFHLIFSKLFHQILSYIHLDSILIVKTES
jgi:hypothetical protein